MARIAVLIITYNSEDEIGSCLEAVRHYVPEAEVLVIDNHSSDQTLEIAARFPVQIIANDQNLGFAGAVNQGVRATSADLLLLLNPDACLETGIGALIQCFDDPKTGAAAGLLRNGDGSPQSGFSVRRLPTPTALILEVLGVNRLFPTNPVNRHYRCLDLDLTQPCVVEQPAGAFLLFSRTAWTAAGGFDECFWPVWFEDVDFCAALICNDFQICFVPECTANHKGGHSVAALPMKSRQKYWYVSLLKYGAKHYRTLAFRLLCSSVAVGSVLRFLLTVGQNQKGFEVQYAVFLHAVGCLFRPVKGSVPVLDGCGTRK